METDKKDFISACDFSKGLIPIVVQDSQTKDVLMLAYTDEEALDKTLQTSQMWFLSRSRGLWHKGDTSGNYLDLVSMHLDCDNDTILAVVKPQGPACHRNLVTCFVETPEFKVESASE